MIRNRILAIATGVVLFVSGATFAAQSALAGEQSVFTAGQTVGAAGDVQLVMQADGNLVLYRAGTPIAASETAGAANPVLTVQGDGNVVLTSGATVVAQSGTAGHPGATLRVQADGNVVVYSADGAPIAGLFSTSQQLALLHPIGTAVCVNAVHEAGWSEQIGDYTLVLQGDGNLVLYQGSEAKASSNTFGAGVRLVEQCDGNVVLYAADGRPLAATGTVEAPVGVTPLVLQADGNAVVYQGGTARWALHGLAGAAPFIRDIGAEVEAGPTGIWAALAQCESGGRANAVSGNGLYHGLYQFSVATWRSVGGSGLPSQASVAEQTLRAQLLQQRSGWGQWPACAHRLGLL